MSEWSDRNRFRQRFRPQPPRMSESCSWDPRWEASFKHDALKKPSRPDPASQFLAGAIILVLWLMIGAALIWNMHIVILAYWVLGGIGGYAALIAFSVELYKKRFPSRR